MKMSRNEIVLNLNREDHATIAREVGLTVDMVRKVMRGERHNDKVWIIAESVANENIRKLRAITKVSEQLAAEQVEK